MTLRYCNRESEEMNSSDMPSAKYSLAGSPLELTSGNTAMDFSEMAALCGPGRWKRKYPAPAASTTMTMTTSCHAIRFGLTTGDGVGAVAAIWRNFSGGSGLPRAPRKDSPDGDGLHA